MECNKDEAVRAKELAQNKMQSNEFEVARKMAKKAQLLFPDLENIAQLLAVCNVHCSAQNRILGTEKDWYGILQLERRVDEVTIKKQYRKLALLLHPDKNQFPGAEAAFKLIGEAHLVLSDCSKKAIYDSKILTLSKPAQSKQPPNISPIWKKNGVNKSMANGYFTQFNVQKNPQAAHVNANSMQHFWTCCPFCSIKYQYHRDFVQVRVKCQNCKKGFIASDTGVPAEKTWTHPVPQAVPVPPRSAYQNQAASKSVPSGFYNQPQASNMHEANHSSVSQNQNARPNEDTAPKANQKKPVEDSGKNYKRKRKSKLDGLYTSTSSDLEEVVIDTSAAQKFGSDRLYNPRRSSREKQNVSYFEPKGEDYNFGCPPQRSRLRKSFVGSEIGNLDSDSDSESSSDDDESSDKHDCPDPEFHNFDKLREENCFSVNQFWACYGDPDSMPRYYAQVKEVRSNPFSVRVSWLEFNPDDDSLASDWDESGLPVGCGIYKRGSRDTVDLFTFSHPIQFDNGKKKGSFIIYPRKGEIWALFRDWDIGWVNEFTRSKKYIFDIVEVLSSFTEDEGIHVTLLEKVKGFVSLFHSRNSDKTICIPLNEMLRFSHMIPFFKMKGDEKDGVPCGSFELDTASINLEPEADLKDPFDPEMPKTTSKKTEEFLSENDSLEFQRGINAQIPDNSHGSQQVFHDFSCRRSVDKFMVGQFWALYDSESRLPKIYGKIKRIRLSPLKLHVALLETLQSENGSSVCGTFKARNEIQFFEPSYFSHLLDLKRINGGPIRIYPKKGQIWALHKNHYIKRLSSDPRNCDYYIVEITDESKVFIEVLFLVKLKDYKSVFGSSEGKLKIPIQEITRFSHEIPSFELTIMGKQFWELDPASIPVNI